MLPLNLLLPIMQAIKELAQNYHCSVVMCTATQPAVQAENGFYRGLEKRARKSPQKPTALFDKPPPHHRANTSAHKTDADLLAKLGETPANARYRQQTAATPAACTTKAKHLEGTFHLTTLMCAKTPQPKAQ